MPFVLMQPVASMEARCVRVALALSDEFEPFPIPCRAQDLGAYVDDLRAARALPVGSVEFVRAAAMVAQRPLPLWSPYPEELAPWLGRRVRRATAGEAALAVDIFVKPVEIKRFNGFVLTAVLSEHDQEQFDILRSLPESAPVWVSDVVEFQSEWRYYLDGAREVGRARYDPDGPDDAARPDPGVVKAMVLAMGVQGPHSIDVGVLEGGETVLVESHDFYALGIYGRSLEPQDYLRLLWARWREHVLCETTREIEEAL